MIFTLALLMACSALAQDLETDPAAGASLADLAAQSDLVALVQVADVDYEYVREFPSGGTAFLRVLIPYRLTHPVGDIVEVYDEGLHEHECYFDNPPAGTEGRRHLVFLRDNPEVEEQFLGLDMGCSLDVLVTAENRYALRYPLAGIRITDDVRGLAKPMDFADSKAFPEEEDITVAERDALLEGDYLERLEDGRYRYTHGIELSDVRPLFGAENLSLDRALRRPVEPD